MREYKFFVSISILKVQLRPWRHYFLQLSTLVYLQASLLTSNPALALPRQGEIKVNTFGVFFLRIWRLRICACAIVENTVTLLTTYLQTLLTRIRQINYCHSFPQIYLKKVFRHKSNFSLIALHHPVPNRACKLLMTIVTQDLIQLWVNRSFLFFFLYRSIMVILLSKFIYSTFSVTTISFPSCNQTHPPPPQHTHKHTPLPAPYII